MYIYPENLRAKATLWLWELRDVAIVGIGLLLSAVMAVQFRFIAPCAVTVAYALVSIRRDNFSVLDFLRFGVTYFLTRQQRFDWRCADEPG